MKQKLIVFALAVVPVAFSQTLTRIQQDDPKIIYTGTWYPNTNSLESGGSAKLANLKGSQAIVLFNGTGINWIGTSDPYSGLCFLTLDGVPTQVDTANPAGATLYQQTLYSVQGLAPGLHRLTIEIFHSHDDASDQSWIWVDAFEIKNGNLVSGPIVANAGPADQTSVSANYSGHWFQNAGAQYSGGSVNSVVDAGAHVDFTFNGTAVTWIGYRDEWSGIAQVSVDGAQPVTVDTYQTPNAAQTPVYAVTGLAPGTHTLTITATGTHSAASGGSWIWVDGFQVSGSGTPALPVISAGGVVNSASFVVAPNNQVAPGQIVSVFGQNFTTSGSVTATSLPLPTQLGSGNTSLTACGVAVPLYIVTPGQINAQIPFECPTSGTTNLTVSVGGQTMTQTFALAPAAPGIYTLNGSGTADGVILHGNNSPVSAGNPAVAGEQVVFYATGLGATTPSFPTGAAVTQTNRTTATVTMTIGGKDAVVTYSGLTVGLAGLYQINAIVPAGLTGNQEVIVTVGGQQTSRSGVTMAILGTGARP